MRLKYGMNPNQEFAELVEPGASLQIVNGNPGFINFLDALNGWQLVREARVFSPAPVAASFKHVSPSGVAIGGEIRDEEREAYYLGDREISPMACAYARARGSDRLASYGDFACLSDPCDVSTARLLRSEVCDGVIAPGYEPDALDVLSQKKRGSFLVFQIDPDYEPAEIEERDVYGFRLRQHRNNLEINRDIVMKAAGSHQETSAVAAIDVALGLVALKYTQSNSICVVGNGQVIGIGAGQQSRILCTRLALSKANRWYQKLQMGTNGLDFPAKSTRTEKDQIVEATREAQFGDRMVLADHGDLTLCSDGYYPQPDNIEVAADAGVTTIAAPMGSIRDEAILEASKARGVQFIDVGIRLFHHG